MQFHLQVNIHHFIQILSCRTSPPQSHLGRVCRYPQVGECTLPLHVLAVVCTVHNETLQDVMGALQGVTECYGSIAHHYGML